MDNCDEINEWFEWKNSSIKSKKIESIEEKFNDYTNICGGEKETDVLYNILYLYAIGLYIQAKQEKNSNDYSVSTRIQKGRKYLASLNYINKNRNKIIDKILNPLAKVYFSYGNLTPMWPGGNTLKGNGNNGYYDNPDIFFRKYKKWFRILKNQDYAFLDMFEDRITDENYESLQSFVNSINDLRQFRTYIDGVVEIIEDRTKKIGNYLNK